MKVRKQSVLFTLLISLLSLFTLSSASAQTVLNYGTGVVGNVDPSSPFVFYSFAGNESDLVSVRLVNLSGDYQPALSVIGTTGQQLAFSNFDVTNPGNNARLDLILPQTGTYGLQVSALGGGSGQFALVLNGVNTANAQPIAPNPTAVPVDFSFAPVQVLRVAGTPAAMQMIRIEGGEVRFAASVHGPDGTLLSTFNSNMMGTGDAVIPAGDSIYTVIVYNLDTSSDPVFVTLGTGSSVPSGPSTSSSSSSSSDSSSAPQPPPPADPNACVVSTGGPVNLRSGPGTNYTILASVPGGSSYPATGQNSGWYVINYQGITGWIAGSVTTVTGPCTSLPVIPAPSTSDSSSSSSSTSTPMMTSTSMPTTAPGMPTSTSMPTTQPGMPTNTPPPMMATNTPPMGMSPTYTYTPPAQMTPTYTYTPPAEPTPTYTYTPPPPTATEIVQFPASPTQFAFNQQPLDTSIQSNDTVSYSFNLPSPGWHLVGFRVNGLTNQAGPNSQRQFTFVVSCASPDLRWGSGGQLGPTPNTCNQAVAHTFRFDSNQLYLSIKLEGGPGVTYTIIATRID